MYKALHLTVQCLRTKKGGTVKPIEVRLFATLREGRGKKVFIPNEDGSLTPRDIIENLQIPLEEVAILLVNGRDGNLDQILIEEDYLSIFPPVGGG